jgi:hypothetical protein
MFLARSMPLCLRPRKLSALSPACLLVHPHNLARVRNILGLLPLSVSYSPSDPLVLSLFAVCSLSRPLTLHQGRFCADASAWTRSPARAPRSSPDALASPLSPPLTIASSDRPFYPIRLLARTRPQNVLLHPCVPLLSVQITLGSALTRTGSQHLLRPLRACARARARRARRMRLAIRVPIRSDAHHLGVAPFDPRTGCNKDRLYHP